MLTFKLDEILAWLVNPDKIKVSANSVLNELVKLIKESTSTDPGLKLFIHTCLNEAVKLTSLRELSSFYYFF